MVPGHAYWRPRLSSVTCQPERSASSTHAELIFPVPPMNSARIVLASSCLSPALYPISEHLSAPVANKTCLCYHLLEIIPGAKNTCSFQLMLTVLSLFWWVVEFPARQAIVKKRSNITSAIEPLNIAADLAQTAAPSCNVPGTKDDAACDPAHGDTLAPWCEVKSNGRLLLSQLAVMPGIHRGRTLRCTRCRRQAFSKHQRSRPASTPPQRRANRATRSMRSSMCEQKEETLARCGRPSSWTRVLRTDTGYIKSRHLMTRLALLCSAARCRQRELNTVPAQRTTFSWRHEDVDHGADGIPADIHELNLIWRQAPPVSTEFGRILVGIAGRR